jgi:hypothetical protein
MKQVRTALFWIITQQVVIFTDVWYNLILIDRRRYLSILDVRSFRGADCDTDHYLAVAKVREKLAVRKQAAQKFDGIRFNLRKLNDLEVRKQYQIEITNRFAALENVRTRTLIGLGKALKKISKPQLQRV